MIAALYRTLTWAALPAGLLYHWYRSVSRGRRPAFAERFGLLSQQTAAKLAGGPVIWLHAVSVGEVIAARTLVQALRQKYQGYRLLLSVTTETGRSVAERDGLADAVIYFPFDITMAVRRLLHRFAPVLIVIMETEIWPVLTEEAARRGIPLMLANGRISERSFPRYRRFAWFFRPVLHRFSLIGMQSAADLERIVAIGAPPQRSMLLGNLKYDIPSSPVTPEERSRLRACYRIPEQAQVLVVASTHPGEEALLLPAVHRLCGRFPELVPVLVPRHPERGEQVALLAGQAGFRVLRRSQIEHWSGECAPGMLLLVDTVGELMQFYALADLAYVGGSLVPTGGHNLLEPASRGIAQLFGPYMNNFREVAALTLSYAAGRQVAAPEAFEAVAGELLADPDQRAALGAGGLRLLAECGGALARHLAAVAGVLRS